MIGTEDIEKQTNIIQNDLPLLLSEDSMKKANVKVDFSNDKMNILHQEVDIVFTCSDHYAIMLCQ